MSDQPCLVKESWLRKIDDSVTASGGGSLNNNGLTSLFYEVRPARLQTAWTQNAVGMWTATACFIVNNIADTSFIFPVYAPTASANPGGTVGTSRFFVVWRGRWELLAEVGAVRTLSLTKIEVPKSLNVSKASFINNVTKTTSSVCSPVNVQTVLSDVTVTNGALVFTTASTTTTSVLSDVTTSTSQAVTSITTTNDLVVSNVEYE